MVAAIRIANVASLFSEGVEEGSHRNPKARSAHSESARERCVRIARAAASLAAPRRFGAFCAGAGLVLRDRFVAQATLPDPRHALAMPQGLCGAAHDLAPLTVFQAYQQGLVLRGPAGPATWWSPGERRLRRPVATHQRGLRPSFDRDADRVIARVSRGCGQRNPLDAERPAIRKVWGRLATRGLLHTFEALDFAGHGIAIGRMFIVTGFHAENDESRDAGLAALESELAARAYAWLDLTLADPEGEIASVETWTRSDFSRLLATNPDGERAGAWRALNGR